MSWNTTNDDRPVVTRWCLRLPAVRGRYGYDGYEVPKATLGRPPRATMRAQIPISLPTTVTIPHKFQIHMRQMLIIM